MTVAGGLRPKILVRRLDLAPQMAAGMPRPARVVQHARGRARPIGVAGADDRLGLIEPVIRPTAMVGMLRRLLHRAGQRHLIARADRDFLRAASGRRSTRGSARSRALRAPARTRSSARCPSRLRPSRFPRRASLTGRSAGNAARTASKTSSGKRIRFSRLPPYSSSRRLDERRQELVQQIAVGAVELDGVEPEPRGAPRRRRRTRRGRAASPCASSASGGFSPVANGTADGATVCQPSVRSGRDLRAALPRHVASRPCARHGRAAWRSACRKSGARLQHARQRLLVLVRPEAEIAVA